MVLQGYAIERVGALTRRHLIGSRAWYPNGSEYLLATQREDGAFRDGSCMSPEDVLGTYPARRSATSRSTAKRSRPAEGAEARGYTSDPFID